MVAMACRAKRKTSLFEACALLHVDRLGTFSAHAEALVRCLSEALDSRAIFYRPGTQNLSFDEAWLMQVINCEARSDEASISLLLGSRIAVENRRMFRFLTARISKLSALTSS